MRLCFCLELVLLFASYAGLHSASGTLETETVRAQAQPHFLPQNKPLAKLRTRELEEQEWGMKTTLSLLLNATVDMYNHISVDVGYDTLYGELVTFPERRPRMFNIILATAKTLLADLVVQCVEQKTHQSRRVFVDWWRAVAFALFGFFYEGLVNWFLYVSVFTQICPDAIRFANSPMNAKLADRVGQREVVEQVFLDNFVCSVLIYFPVFYIIKEAVYMSRPTNKQQDKLGDCDAHEASTEGLQVLRVVRSAIAKYLNNIKVDNIASCSVFVPLDFVMFSLPMYLRMPFGHFVSFVWTMLLSHLRGAIH